MRTIADQLPPRDRPAIAPRPPEERGRILGGARPASRTVPRPVDRICRRRGDRIRHESRDRVPCGRGVGTASLLICVGREEEPCRIRRATFPYDASYRGEALPLIRVEFRQASGSPGIVLDRVVPDTGADASVLPWADWQLLQLTPALGVQGLISGVAGSSAATLGFQVWAQLDGQDYPRRLQADFVGSDRILGRDVLNRLEILFRGPAGEVVVNP